MNGRLTLDYGLRFTHQQPQYDQNLQASNFFTDKWTAANAPLLYLPGCPGTSIRALPPIALAVNPVTGALLGPGSAAAIGTIVPNSGNATNGLIQNGQGIAKENYTAPAVVHRAALRRARTI